MAINADSCVEGFGVAMHAVSSVISDTFSMAGMGLNITAGVGISFGLNEGGVLLRSEMKKVLLYFT